MNNEHDNLGNPAEEIASIPTDTGQYVEPSPTAWADLSTLTQERDRLWERVKILETEGVDVDSRRRADAAERYIETLTKDVAMLKADAKAAWAARQHVLAESVDLQKALTDALHLIAYLTKSWE